MLYIEFDTSPINEPGVQVSHGTDYLPAMRNEAKRMLELLQNRFPDVEGYFSIKSCEHDFGTYLEIRFHYEDSDKGVKEMQHVEQNYPLTWSDTEPVLLYTT